MNNVDRITRHEWRYVANASRADFELLVAAQEWQVLDNLAAKITYYGEKVAELSPDQQDFLDLCQYTTEYLEANGQLPSPLAALVAGSRESDL